LINKIKEYSVKNDIKVLVDSKPYNFTLFKDFYLIKPNFREFCKMIKTEIKNSDEDIKKYALEFAKKMNTNLVITR
jgi:bifunctional ADP-heptose synthase (sugar kinase/adenylyltransferase)